MLKVVRVSQAQALQRTGRAGREAEGHCYRMLTKAVSITRKLRRHMFFSCFYCQEFDRLSYDSVPEILRCNLSTVLLQMLYLGVRNIAKFDFMEGPPPEAVEGAFRQLRLLGAVDSSDCLTELGKKMAAFPLDPKFTKIIFRACELGCRYS